MNENQSLAWVAVAVVYLVAGAASLSLAFILLRDPPFPWGPAVLFGALGLGLLGAGVATWRQAWPPRRRPAPWVPLAVGGGLLIAALFGLAWLAAGLAILAQGHP